jgi:hypothetical protein
MRYAWMMGALALTTVTGNVYAQDADGEPRKDDVSEDGAVSPDPDKDTLKEGENVAQAGRLPGSGRRNDGRTDTDDEPDEVTEPEEIPTAIPARVPWRGTAFNWGHDFTTSAVGLGSDFQGGDYQTYTQTFSLGLNYFVIDQEKWSLALNTGPSVTTELTNSNITTTRNEPQMNDLPTSVVYRRRLYSHDELPIATGLVLNARVLWPTSPASYNSGTYLTTSPAVVMWQSFPVIPKDVAPVLNSIAVGFSGRWNHRFGRATTGVNDDLQRPRQNQSGATFIDNQLAGNRIGQDNIREGFFLFLSQPIGPTQLVLFAGAGFSQIYQGGLGEVDCINLPTGCVTEEDVQNAAAAANFEPTDWQFSYDFAVGGNFFPIPEAGLSFGYSNATNQLGPDGQRRSILYTPNAQFSLGMIVSIDAIYEAISGPRRISPFVLVAKNEKKKKEDKRREQDERKKAMELPVTF